jgi:hypothetical protein
MMRAVVGALFVPACSGIFGVAPNQDAPPDGHVDAPPPSAPPSGDDATPDAPALPSDGGDGGGLDADASGPRLSGLPESNGVDGTTWKENRFTTLLADAVVGTRSLEVLAQRAGRAPFEPVVGAVVLVWQTVAFEPALLQRPFNVAPTSTVGRYTVVRVSAVAKSADGLTLTLDTPLGASFSARGAQVVWLPQYTDIRVPGGVEHRAAKWDGATGGVLAFLARGRVTIDGALSASGAGLGGAAPMRTVPRQFGCAAAGTTLPAHAPKGEGIAVGPVTGGVERVANGGGGGACHNAGGGGGALVSPAGVGGMTLPSDGSRAVGGEGGAALPFAPLQRLFAGGGGGAGEQDDALEGAGGAGGGLLLIGAMGSIDVVGRVESSGGPGGTSALSGGGGGGAGGMILLRSTYRVLCGASVVARGGSGGTTGPAAGPGGGGSGGAIVIDAPNVATSTADCPVDVTGGSAGTSVDTGTSRGATPGSAGRAAWGPLQP